MATGTDKKGENLPDLDDLLQCPVCYEIPSGQIFQCNEGHHVCGRCKARLDQCPVCRALFFGTRNYAMEELIANVRKLRAFKLGGKMTITSPSTPESTAQQEVSVPEETLGESVEDEEVSSTTSLAAPAACKGLFRCLCCENGNAERLPLARLLNHLRYFHAPDLIEGKSENGEYVQAWQIGTLPGRIVIAVRVADMGIFYLVIEKSKESIYAWVSMASSPWVSHNFWYTITISGNDREVIFTDCVWSVRSCEGALKKRNRCLTVSGADVRALTATADVSGRLTLRRAPAELSGVPPQPRAVLRVASRGTAAPTPPTRQLEPFLQDLQNDVERLSRVFANLGREAEALDRSADNLRSRTENGRRQDAAPEQQNVVTESQQVQDRNANNNERTEFSRSARRRMRIRLRAALIPQAAAEYAGGEGPVPPPPVAPPHAPAPAGGPSNGTAPSRNKKKRRQRR